MGINNCFAGFAIVLSVVLAHGVHDHYPLGPIERRNLNHCHKEFSQESFVKRTLEIHEKEFDRLRRDLRIDAEADKQR